MENLKLVVSAHDISEAEWFRINNPILFVLQNATRTLWRMNEDGIVSEAMKPNRIGQLPGEALTHWHEYVLRGHTAPFEFELDLYAPEIQELNPVRNSIQTNASGEVTRGAPAAQNELSLSALSPNGSPPRFRAFRAC